MGKEVGFMNEIIIIAYGYDNEQSNNPNAICLYEIINSLIQGNKVHIITTTMKKKDYYKVANSNIEIHYIPISIKKNGKPVKQ